MLSNLRIIGFSPPRAYARDMHIDPITIAVTLLAIFLVSFPKGAFGGGLGLLGIPILSFVMDPISAGALLAPMFVVMDMIGLRYWRPSTWSRPDAKVLAPSVVVGIGIGYAVLNRLDHRAIAILIAVITLGFAAHFFASGRQMKVRQRSTPRAITAGTASGVASMVAHSGGPPLAVYVLSLGLSKEAVAGTMSVVFMAGNATKAVPWLLLARPDAHLVTLMAISIPAVVLSVWGGWQLHQRVDQRQLYTWMYALLILTSVKLFADGLTGYVPGLKFW